MAGWRGFRFGKRVLRGASWRLRLSSGGWRDYCVAKRVPLRSAGGRTTARACRCATLLLLFFRRHGKQWPVLSRFLRGPVVPSNEQRDVVRIVDRLNGDTGHGWMELAHRLRDLSDDRK